jgi:hypothetical protein
MRAPVTILIGLLALSLSACQNTSAGKAEVREYIKGSTKNYVSEKDTLSNKIPEGAIKYLAKGESKLVTEREGKKNLWVFDKETGILSAKPKWQSLVTSKKYNDFIMHIEFNVNDSGHMGKEFAKNGNSGIYIQKRYELQILNSIHRNKEYTTQDCGSLYKLKMPDLKVCKKAGEWQSYDIVFRSARFKDGKKVENAKITAYQNNKLIHDDYSIPRKTGAGSKETPEAAVIKLQGHDNPVKFKNFWVKSITIP